MSSTALYTNYGKGDSVEEKTDKTKIKMKEPSVQIRRVFKKRKDKQEILTNKRPKTKESKSGLSKGTKSQSKSSEKSEKLDWDNLEGGDYPFDLTKPLPLVMNRNHQIVPVDYFFNNDLNISCKRNFEHAYTEFHNKDKGRSVEVMRKHGYGYLKEIEVRRADNKLYSFKEGDFPPLRINDIEDMLMRLDELYKFSDGTLTRLQSSLDDITKNIKMEYPPQRRWGSL
ncbi:hypothetical protein Tco_0285746 [Tanacetum coccineum]